MPQTESHCAGCDQVFLIRRNPTQRYCSQAGCQRLRKNEWRRRRRSEDVDYRENQREANRRWRASHSGYWRDYRESHPAYVDRQREQQRERDQRRLRKKSAQKIIGTDLAKSDAFDDHLFIESGSYDLIPAHGALAKSDALRVKIIVVSKRYDRSAHLAKRPPYSQGP